MIAGSERALSLWCDPAFSKLKERLIGATGLVYYESRDPLLARIVETRLAELALENCQSYLELLSGEPGAGEFRAMATRMVVGETYFFRNREHFDALRASILPDILARQAREKRLYIWSAGCSSGEEAYSISILLRREFAHQTAGWDIRILGTDISDGLLVQAREGRFPEWAFRSTPEDIKEFCFQKDGGFRTIKPEYKELVSFEYHNLIDGRFPPCFWPAPNFHLILCRNVLIYFNAEYASRIIQRFHQSVAENGWLIVGPAETDIAAFRSFFLVNCGGPALYQKRSDKPEVQSSETNRLSMSVPVAPVETGSIGPHEPAGCVASEAEHEESDGHSGLANIRLLANRGAWEHAAQCCEQIRERDGLNPLVYFYHAMVADHLGNTGEARQLLRKAVYLDGQFVLGHYHLGLVLKKQNDTKDAARHFRIALELLSGMQEDQNFEEGDGITARELKELAKLHLEVLKT